MKTVELAPDQSTQKQGHVFLSQHRLRGLTSLPDARQRQQSQLILESHHPPSSMGRACNQRKW